MRLSLSRRRVGSSRRIPACYCIQDNVPRPTLRGARPTKPRPDRFLCIRRANQIVPPQTPTNIDFGTKRPKKSVPKRHKVCMKNRHTLRQNDTHHPSFVWHFPQCSLSRDCPSSASRAGAQMPTTPHQPVQVQLSPAFWCQGPFRSLRSSLRQRRRLGCQV